MSSGLGRPAVPPPPPFLTEQHPFFKAGYAAGERPRGREYLLLKSKWGCQWGFPKGHRERHDLNSEETAWRETEEETGLTADDLDVLEGLHFDIEPPLPRPTKKIPSGIKRVRMYVAKKATMRLVTLSREHTETRWLRADQAAYILPPTSARALAQADAAVASKKN